MNDLLVAIRAHLQNSAVRVPSPTEAWSVREGRLEVVLDGARLGENIQRSGPSIPSYVFSLSYWYEQATGKRLDGVVRVVGVVPDTPAGNRARFMLTELAAALGESLRVEGLVPWSLPARPVMNAPLAPRPASLHAGSGEHQVEVLLTLQASTPMGQLQRQFPLGLFNERKSTRTRLFPGGGAQADLWSFDEETRTLHLVELKVGGNATVGIIPEAFTYAMLLRRFASHPRASWSAEWEGARGAREAERVVMWLAAEKFHPLVYSAGRSPLSWLNDGLEETGVEFRIVPIDVNGHQAVRWGTRWPPARSR
jgi:hypothetical protein